MVDPYPNGTYSNTNESRLADLAAHFDYPATPDIATRERRRLANAGLEGRVSVTGAGRRARLAAGAAAMVLLLVAALLVPQTRAALLQIFDIGAIRILADEEPATVAPLPGAGPLSPAGATTLAEAMKSVGFDVLLPTYPADLGPPSQVYVQQIDAAENDEQVVIMAWLDPARPDEIALSLYQIAVPFYGIKQASLEMIRETRVNGQPAFWVVGPHRLQLQDGDYQEWYFVPGNVLLWTNGQMTYRLESGLSLDEAIRIAESLARPG